MNEYLEKWSGIALEKRWVESWVEGAIFTREMVFFMARCEELKITRIVESGRQDGFSTLILGEFSRRTNVKVYSIDYEADAQRAARCRERLKPYPELNLLKGDANILIGKTVAAQTGERVALLVDGPKGYWAMSLMFAAASFPQLQLLALHNLEEGYPIREFFAHQSAQPSFYEEAVKGSGPTWAELGAVETAFCDSVRARRSLEKSSLGVMVVTPEVRSRLTSLFDSKFRLFQPPIVRTAWKYGLFRPAKFLYDFSLRFLPVKG